MKLVVIVGLSIIDLALLLILARVTSGSTNGGGSPESESRMWHDDPSIIELIYAEAQLTRSMSAATVDELRVRASAALTILATTTAIFVAVATASGASHPSIADSPLELTALALFFVATLALAIILMPIVNWSFWPDIHRMDEYTNQGCDKDGIQMEIVNDIASALVSDGKPLRRLQWLFIAAIVSFIAEVVFWIVGILH